MRVGFHRNMHAFSKIGALCLCDDCRTNFIQIRRVLCENLPVKVEQAGGPASDVFAPPLVSICNALAMPHRLLQKNATGFVVSDTIRCDTPLGYIKGANRRRTARKIRMYHLVCLQVSRVISSQLSRVLIKSSRTWPTARERYIQMPHSKWR